LHLITLNDTNSLSLSHTHTFDRTSLDEGSVRRRSVYLQNTQHSQETNIHAPGGLEPAIPGCERLQTYTYDRAATGMGRFSFLTCYIKYFRQKY
jgi:hypothetical protein